MQPVRVDVGVVCLWLGRVSPSVASSPGVCAADLIQRADKLMYEAKGERANHIHLVRAKIDERRPRRHQDGDPSAADEKSRKGNVCYTQQFQQVRWA